MLNLNRDIHVSSKRLQTAAIILLCFPLTSFAGALKINSYPPGKTASASINPVPFTKNVPYQTITGKVTDAKNNPLQGVTVLIKGTKIGTSTGTNGTFSITNAPQAGTLIFSSAGFAILRA